uniref:Uncharacterized protein n=1 Tax=Anguilla anguilla TaxID=7936 RepID=A0A0E9SGB0_ANGAN
MIHTAELLMKSPSSSTCQCEHDPHC